MKGAEPLLAAIDEVLEQQPETCRDQEHTAECIRLREAGPYG